MYNFQLTGEQRQYQELARAFTRDELESVAAQPSEPEQFSADPFRQAWETGLINLLVPEALGGAGTKTFDACIIAEELGAYCTGFAVTCMANDLALTPLVVAGTHEQQKTFLGELTSDFCFAGFASVDQIMDPVGKTLEARRDNDGYVINGCSTWVINAQTARWFYVCAWMGDSGGSDGSLTSFVVPADTLGISVGQREQTVGWRRANLHSVTWQDVRVPASYRLGSEGEGQLITMCALSRMLPIMGASAVGLARSSLKHSIAYAKTRHAFGHPIADYQAVSFMLADTAKDTEAARLMCWQAAWLCDQNAADLHQSCLVAKTFAADAAMQAATNAVQIFGGYGYACEYPVEKLMRDAKMFQLFFGTGASAKVALGKELVR